MDSTAVLATTYSLPLRSEYRFTQHKNKAQNLSNMWRSTFEIGTAQLAWFLTEIAPKSPFLCLNRSSIRCGFRTGEGALWYGVNIASNVLNWCRKYFEVSITFFEKQVTSQVWIRNTCHNISIIYILGYNLPPWNNPRSIDPFRNIWSVYTSHQHGIFVERTSSFL